MSSLFNLDSDKLLDMDETINVPKENVIAELFKFLGAGFLLLLVCYGLLLLAVHWLIPLIPPKQERVLTKVATVLIKQEKIDLQAEKSLTPLFNNLLEAAHMKGEQTGLPLQLHVINKSNMINAFALPGGHIVTYTGLLVEFPNRSEQLFILAHELGHFKARHHLKSFTESMGSFLLLSPLMLLAPEIGNTLGLLRKIDATQHSQAHELEADRFALHLMAQLNEDLMAPIRVFKRFHALNPQEFETALESSHPTSLQRIEQVKTFLEQQTH